MSQTQRAPFRTFLWVAVLVWLLPLAAWLFVRYESGYFSTRPDEMKDDRDQGFRPEASASEPGRGRCPGLSPGWLGTCGRIEGRSLSEVFLNEYSADGLNLSSVLIERSRWEWVSLQLAQWSRTKVVGTELNDVDLSSSELRDVEFREGAWRGTRLDAADLKDVTFTNMQMEEVSFRGARFKKVRILGSSCIRCDFRDAVFEESSLDGNFYNSYYNEGSVLPFPLDEIGIRHFRYIQ